MKYYQEIECYECTAPDTLSQSKCDRYSERIGWGSWCKYWDADTRLCMRFEERRGKV